MADAKSIEPQESALTRAWNWLTETQVWTSIFRHAAPINDRNRVLVMLSNIFLHLHPVRLKKHGVRFPDAELVLFDPMALTYEDEDAEGEQRFVSTGCVYVSQRPVR